MNEAMAARLEGPATRTLKKMKYTYEDCVDRMIADPTLTQNELAAIYDRRPSWMSVVINSDAFQARLAARRKELVDPGLQVTVDDRFRALTIRSLEVLQHKLEKAPELVPDQLALQAAALGAKSLGIGVAAPPAPPPAADRLSSLATRLIDLQASVRRTGGVEGEVVEVRVREVTQESAA